MTSARVRPLNLGIGVGEGWPRWRGWVFRGDKWTDFSKRWVLFNIRRSGGNFRGVSITFYPVKSLCWACLPNPTLSVAVSPPRHLPLLRRSLFPAPAPPLVGTSSLLQISFLRPRGSPFFKIVMIRSVFACSTCNCLDLLTFHLLDWIF